MGEWRYNSAILDLGLLITIYVAEIFHTLFSYISEEDFHARTT
jgi:hypothetical protein